jgi:hypothetical protein
MLIYRISEHISRITSNRNKTGSLQGVHVIVHYNVHTYTFFIIHAPNARITDPIKAAKYDPTENPGTNTPTNQNKTAFSITEKIPRVRRFNGTVTIFKIGLIAELITKKITPTITPVKSIASRVISGTKKVIPKTRAI